MTLPTANNNSWSEGEEFLASKGFTEHYDIGSGNEELGYGSRHFFKKPGVDADVAYATLTYHDGRWNVTVHEKNPRRRILSIVGGTDYE